MAGMSRDKCGATNVVSVLRAVSLLKPKDLKVIGAMDMVRNSVGEAGYVSDEITSRVGNTVAEVSQKSV